MRTRLGVVLAVLLTSAAGSAVSSGAAASSVAPPDPAVIAGWSGSDPTPLSVAAGTGGALSAAFTTSDTDGDDLWLADRSPADVWGTTEVADHVVPGTAALRVNDSGAAVAAWQAMVGTSHILMVSTRSSTAAAWAAPVSLATDDDATRFTPFVGIDDAGRSTVGYLHLDESGTTGVYTSRHETESWSAPDEQSDAPAEQMRLEVSVDGTVTLAWTQEDGGQPGRPVSADDPDSILVRRLVQPSDVWADAQGIGATYPGGLLDLAVSDNGMSTVALDYRFGTTDITLHQLEISRSSEEPPFGTLCQPTCQWIGNPVGGTPSAALGVADSAGAFVVSLTNPDAQGRHELGAEITNGTYFGGSALVDDTSLGDNVSPVVAYEDYRGAAAWTTHTPDGDIASVRSMWLYDAYAVRQDPDTYRLGPSSSSPAITVTSSGDTVAVWADTTTTPVLRVSTLSATQMVWPDQKFAAGRRVPVRWTTTGSNDRYYIGVRSATVRHRFGSRRIRLRAVRDSQTRLRIPAGATACFSSRTKRPNGYLSSWSTGRCTTAPLNDQALVGHGWQVDRENAALRHEVRVSSRHGARLSLPGARGRAIALLVHREPSGGRLRVMLGHRRLGVIDTSGKRRARVVIQVARFHAVHTGRLRLEVVSHHRPVEIDGVYVGR